MVFHFYFLFARVSLQNIFLFGRVTDPFNALSRPGHWSPCRIPVGGCQVVTDHTSHSSDGSDTLPNSLRFSLACLCIVFSTLSVRVKYLRSDHQNMSSLDTSMLMRSGPSLPIPIGAGTMIGCKIKLNIHWKPSLVFSIG